jgi:hypothetical protein
MDETLMYGIGAFVLVCLVVALWLHYTKSQIHDDRLEALIALKKKNDSYARMENESNRVRMHEERENKVRERATSMREARLTENRMRKARAYEARLERDARENFNPPSDILIKDRPYLHPSRYLISRRRNS